MKFESMSVTSICQNSLLGLAFVLFAPRIAALGLGEIHVTSKLGEHFNGRISLLSAPGESVDPACFKLLNESPSRDGIPLVDSAKLVVTGGGGEHYLRVSSRKIISDLAVRLVIKAGCESEITREYTILLDLPDNGPTAQSDRTVVSVPLGVSPQPVSPPRQRDRRPSGLEWEITAGESLAGIAANLYPDSRSLQRRFIRHVLAANSAVIVDKNPDALLPVGEVLHFPDLKELARKPVEKESGWLLATESVVSPDTKPGTLPVSRKTAKSKKPGTEADVRLKLSTGDLDVSSSGKVTEGEREMLREKQRILMDIDDIAAYNLSLNHRLKQMEEHLQGLQAKLELLESQRSEMAADRPASPALSAAPKPSQAAWEWPAYSEVIAFAAAGVGLLMAAFWAYSKRKRKPAEDEAMMELDVGLDRALEASPAAEKQVASVSPADSVSLDVLVEPTVVSAGVPEAQSQPPIIEEPKERYSVSDYGIEIALARVENEIEEANIYLALGEKNRAIANLKYYIDSEPRSSVDLWLKLLEIYHDFDMRPEFEILANDFHRYFNIAKPSWGSMVPGAIYTDSIEQFPRLLEKITSTWGSLECLEYLHHLLRDNRDGLREGFELGIASEILQLIRLLEGKGRSADRPAGKPPGEETGVLEFTFDSGFGAPIEFEQSDDGGGRAGGDKEGISESMMLAPIVIDYEDVPDIWNSSEENKMAAKKDLKPRQG